MDRLSKRETQVLDSIASGATSKEIGQELGISEPTVKFHVANSFRKLGAKSRTEAVALAIARSQIRGHDRGNQK